MPRKKWLVELLPSYFRIDLPPNHLFAILPHKQLNEHGQHLRKRIVTNYLPQQESISGEKEHGCIPKTLSRGWSFRYAN